MVTVSTYLLARQCEESLTILSSVVVKFCLAGKAMYRLPTTTTCTILSTDKLEKHTPLFGDDFQFKSRIGALEYFYNRVKINRDKMDK